MCICICTYVVYRFTITNPKFYYLLFASILHFPILSPRIFSEEPNFGTNEWWNVKWCSCN